MHTNRWIALVLLAALVGCDTEGSGPRSPDATSLEDAGEAGDGAAPDGTVDEGARDMPLDEGARDATVDMGRAVDASPTDGAANDPDAALPMGDGCEALQILEQRCAGGGCHLPHNRRTRLVLTREAMQRGSLVGYVVPGEPAASYLVERMYGRGEGPLMPLGAVAPIEEVGRIEAWIAEGAPTRCDAPATPTPSDPNHLDPDALFVCADGDGAATPARLRRVGQREWTRAVVKPLSGTWWGSTAKDNPFAPPDRLPYSTWPADVTIDPATLDLYMLVLPEAPALWNTRDPVRGNGQFIPGTRTQIVYRNPELRCIFDDAAPDDACIDGYVDVLLRHGVLFRTPRDDERQRVRAFLVQALAAEGEPGARRATLQFVGEATFLMTGALFRSEIGAPDPQRPGGWRLSADEMALALGRVLSAHPVGAPLPIDVEQRPDADHPMSGRLGLIRQAADDGTIFDPVVIADLLAAYRGGIDPERLDLVGEPHALRLPSRGEYWLAENIQQFFREWLDYSAAGTVFKDTPSATTAWHGLHRGEPMYDPTTTAYRSLQTGAPGRESTLVQQLDDTIARAVIDSHARGTDVFETLMTTRTWRLPSNLAALDERPCDGCDDCDPGCPRRPESSHPVCTARGVCGTTIAHTILNNTRVYDLDVDVRATADGRWVEVPADERAGVLTHPAWLSAHGGNFEDDASAVERGKWIREQLFCETVPGLERVQAEAQLVPSAPGVSARERLRRSVDDPQTNPQAEICRGCHVLMNSLGLPFETFNHAGFVRRFDHGPDGNVPPSGQSRIEAPPEAHLDIEVDGPVAFAEALAGSTVARRCFVRQTFRYFVGRAETLADACVLSEMEAALDRSGSFFDMLQALVTHPVFQRRAVPMEAP